MIDTKKSLQGFTLLELVITIAVLGLMIPAMLGLVIQLSALSLKWQKTIAVKNDAFQALSIIKTKIRDEAVSVSDDICYNLESVLTPSPTYSPSLVYLDKTGSSNTFLFSDKLTFTNGTSQQLHSQQTKFPLSNNIGFRCLIAEDDFFNKKEKIINVSLDAVASTNNPDLVVPTIHLQTSIKLRNH